MPLVSVVTPAWNAEEYVAATIGSVRAQTMADWEMLIVDDCSRDRTAAVVEKLADEDRRLRLSDRWAKPHDPMTTLPTARSPRTIWCETLPARRR